MSAYVVKNIFGPTLQGEGSHTGRVVKFLRFAGCNRWTGRPQDQAKSVCWFCDTDFYAGTKYTAVQIGDALDALGDCKTVVISGGEPALQIDDALLQALTERGYVLHLETNGSIALGPLHDYFEHISMSPKQCRSETKLERCQDVKILYPSPINEVSPEAFQDFPAACYYVQPLDESNKTAEHTREAIAFCLEHPNWRLSLQTHKITGVE